MQVRYGDRVTIQMTGKATGTPYKTGAVLEEVNVDLSNGRLITNVQPASIIAVLPPIQRPGANVLVRFEDEGMAVEAAVVMLYDADTGAYVVRRPNGCLAIVPDDERVQPEIEAPQEVEAPEPPPLRAQGIEAPEEAPL